MTRRALGGAALAPLLLLLLSGPAAAQVPPLPDPSGATDPVDNIVRVSVDVEPAFQDVPRNGQARYRLLVQDISGESEARQANAHYVFVRLEVNRTASPGWVAFMGPSFFVMQAGEVQETFVMVQAPPTIRSMYFTAKVTASISSGVGGASQDDADITARVAPFSLASVDIRAAPASVGPFEETSFPVLIRNDGLYPDSFDVQAVGPDGWIVNVQPRLTLFPGEERPVTVQVVTPATRVFVPQETGVIFVRVSSPFDPGVVHERAAVITLQGFFLPDYWFPVLALGAVLAGATATRAREAARRRAKEQGRPLPPRLTPAQRVLLADLKHRDPGRHAEIVGRQRAVFRARERAFAAVRGKRARLEQSLVERQRAQARGEKLAEQQRLKALDEKQRELQRRREAIELDQQRRARAEEAERKRQQARLERAERERARREAPNLRREAAQRRAEERRLRAELARRKRQLRMEERKRAAEERKRRAELERKVRMMERKRKALERRAGRAQKPKEGRRRGRKGNDGGEGGEGSGGAPGQGGDPGA